MLSANVHVSDTGKVHPDAEVRLLLVDDDEDEFHLLQDALKEATGKTYILDWAGNYKDAIEHITEDLHDAYLIDYHLGGKTGLDLIREAMERIGCRKPLIMITGFGNQRLDEAVLSLGGADFISKHELTPVALDRVITHAITRTKRERRFRDWAMQDTLTGLSNRQHINQILPRMVTFVRNQKQNLAVLYMDLDGFKIINDTAGHNFGDSALKAVASRWSKLIRGGDLLARVGGDEFVAVALFEEPDLSLPTVLGRRLISALESPFQLNGKVFQLGVSIGLACYPLHGKSAASLLEKADQAMYEAKRQGGNRICLALGDELPTEEQH